MKFAEAVKRQLPEAVIVEFGARGADDFRLWRYLVVSPAVKQGWDQLAQGKIAGGAEDDKVEGADRNELRR